MNRKKCFSKRNEEYLRNHRHSFVGYLTAGYPDREHFFTIVREAEECGMGIFEIGFPSGNPYADGELIRESHKMIDHDIISDMSFWLRLREEIDNPIWLMGYKEDLIDSEIYKKIAEIQAVDAFVIPNLNIDDRIRLLDELKEYGIDMLAFIGDRMEWENNYVACEKFPIIYQQLYSGPTGCVNNTDTYKTLFECARKASDGYLFAGFGIKTTDRVKELLRDGFDGVIIGTAIIQKLNSSAGELMKFLKNMEKAVEGVD